MSSGSEAAIFVLDCQVLQQNRLSELVIHRLERYSVRWETCPSERNFL
jgi:hypothetical protein